MKSGTYYKIYIQIIFAVKNRDNLIQPDWEEELFKYITGILKEKGQKLLAINGTKNHIHILIGFNKNFNLSDLVRELKKSSTNFINNKKFSKFKFNWQEGYGAFSYSHSQIPSVVNYIENQKEHHKKVSFRDEYLNFLKNFDIKYDTKFLFEWIDE